MAELSPLPILPPPGVVLTEAERVIEGRWSAALNVRFVKGLPQKIGGNVRAVTQPTSGTPRALHAWRDNSQNNYLAAGTYGSSMSTIKRSCRTTSRHTGRKARWATTP